jgi:L-seryl-tRNA(Ser) seleniumtransferase
MQDKSRVVNSKKLRQIPSIEEILQSEKLKKYISFLSRLFVTQISRKIVDELRKQVKRKGLSISKEEIITKISEELENLVSASLRPVINGTGVIIHTNLGRAPIGENVLKHMAEVSKNYSSLEYDLVKGKRGERTVFLEKLLIELSGAEGALVVNNNAGAVLLILSGLAKGKEVIISRGELVQIGGGFRIPDILNESGAIMKEVGTTNQTSISDYQRAINKNTKILLKVHKSNFWMSGFVEEVSIEKLIPLGKKYRLITVEDLGSGAMTYTENYGLGHEPRTSEAVSTGVDLVCFSGDKLLGGPQAGIILGKKKYIDLLRKHPLYRALRIDKMVITGLEQVILSYLKKEEERIPIWRLISTPLDALRKRGEEISRRLKDFGISVSLKESRSTVGGGSLPGETLPTFVLSMDSQTPPEYLAEKFRSLDYPIIGRIEKNRFVLDLRTIFPEQDEMVIKEIKNVILSPQGEEST